MTVRIQTEDFDAAAEVARLRGRRTDIGAIVTFTGICRDNDDGRALAALTLETYADMAVAEIERIVEEAKRRWPLHDALVIHRYGLMRPGDDIVLVVTASAHREAAFRAAAFLMDYLKTRAPFWKSEETSAGERSWVTAKDSDDAAAARW